MSVAALYDIHGNLPALEAVLAEIARLDVEQVVVGGDVVPGPLPRETMARLADLGRRVRYIRGNGETAVLAARSGAGLGRVPASARDAVRWVAAQLDAPRERELASWPATVRLHVDGLGEVLFCHATPRSEDEIFTRLTPEDHVASAFAGADVDVVVCGHTHMQFDRRIGAVRVLNAGSVGMPFGVPGAYWLLLGPGVEPRRTRYDTASAASRIAASGYPDATEFAERYVVRPPSEQEMLEAFGGENRGGGRGGNTGARP